MDADSLKGKRSTAKAQFTRSETKLNDSLTLAAHPAQKIPLTTIKRRFEDVADKWAKVENAHDAYLAALPDPTQIETEEVWIQDISARFDSLEIKVDQYIEKEQAPKEAQNVAGAQNTSTTDANVSNRKLKFDIQVEKFDGDIRKYPEFRETFRKHVQAEFTDGKHAFVLRNYLTESVREEVSHIGENYDKLWERLDQKYGDVGKLVDAILFQIKNLPSSTTDSNTTLQMIKVIEKAHRDLVGLKQDAEMHNGTTISMIEERLPLNIRQEWVKLVASKQLNSREKFIMLMDLLGDWRCRLEYSSDSIRVVPQTQGSVFHMSHQQQGYPAPPHILPSPNHPPPHNLPANRNNQRKHPGCWLHKAKGEAGEHPIWRCRDFQNRPIEERLQLVILNNACHICLLQTCPGASRADQCPTSFTCKINGCGKRHNQLLHVDQQQQAGGTPSTPALLLQSL